MDLTPFLLIGVALLLTIAIEIAVAIILGYKKKEELLVIFGVNLITNPIVNYFVMLLTQLAAYLFSIPLLLLFEIVVVIFEAKILSFVLKKGTKEMLILSIWMNGTSFLLGIILFWK